MEEKPGEQLKISELNHEKMHFQVIDHIPMPLEEEQKCKLEQDLYQIFREYGKAKKIKGIS